MADETGNELDHRIRQMLDSCESALDGNAGRWAKAIAYYNGRLPDVDTQKDSDAPEPVVMATCKEHVRKLMPSVMRTVLSENIVKYTAPRPEDAGAAEMVTEYVNKVLYSQHAFKAAIYDGIHDAMVMDTGIYMWEAVKVRKVLVSDFSNQTAEMLEAVMLEAEGGGNEVTDVEQGEDGLYSFSLQEVEVRTEIRLACIPRNDFLIYPDAETVEDSPLVGHRRFATRGELIDMGYDATTVKGLPAQSERRDDEVEFSRFRNAAYQAEFMADGETVKSQERVKVYEVYVRLQPEDDGGTEIHHFVLGDSSRNGDATRSGYTVLYQEQVNEVPYAAVRTERIPHTFEGRGIVEELMPYQKIITVLSREAINNVQSVNSPQVFIRSDAVEDPDSVYDRASDVPVLLKGEHTAAEAIQFSQVPALAGQSMEMAAAMDRRAEMSSGITDASGNVDPANMQNVTATEAMIQSDASVAQSEMMIQEIREGLRVALKGIYGLVVNHVEPDLMAAATGDSLGFAAYDVSSWPSEVDCDVQTGQSAGARSVELGKLALVREQQGRIYKTFGPDNPWVSEEEMVNLERRMVETAGLPGTEQYFRDPSDEEVAAWRERRDALAQREAELAESAQLHAQAMDTLKVEHEAALAAAKADAQIAVEKAQQDADLTVRAAERQNALAIERVKSEANVRIADMRETTNLLVHREGLNFRYDELGVKRVEAGLPERDPDQPTDQPDLPFPDEGEGDLPFPEGGEEEEDK